MHLLERIQINILNFKYLKTKKAHTCYRLKEFDTNEELTLDKVSALENAERKGEYNKAIENARNFLNLGISVEIVAQGTGLSLEEVNKIKDELNK